MKKVVSLLLAAAMVASLAACGSSSSSTSSSTASTASSAASSSAASSSASGAKTSTKDTLVVEIASDGGDFSPFGSNNDVVKRIKYACYETLVDIAEDGTASPSALAESLTQVDGSHWTVKVAKGHIDSYGNEITASDVKWCIEAAKASSAGYAKYVQTIETAEVDANDPYAINISLTYNDAFFMEAFSGLTIVSQASYEKSADNMKTEAVGSGPYMWDSYTSGSEVKLKRNPNYYGEAAPIANITFRFIAESSQRAIELETGAIDFVFDLGVEDYLRMVDDSNYNIEKIGTSAQVCLYFNVSEYSVCKDQKVRQAIAYAINAEDIANVSYKGTADVSTAFMPKASKDYGADFNQGTLYAQDLDKAKSLLAEAGYSNLKDITINLITNQDSYYTSIAEITRNTLVEKLGINCNVNSYETAVYSTMRGDPSQGWDMFVNVLSAPSGRFVDMVDAFFNQKGQNQTTQQNAELQAFIEKGVTTTDEAEMKTLVKDLNTLLTNECYCIPLIMKNNLVGYVKNLEGFVWTHSIGNLRYQNFYFN